MRFAKKLFLSLAFPALLAGTACRKPLTTSNEVVAVSSDALPADPADSLWDKAPEHSAALLLQDVVDPRLMKASTGTVRIRALADDSTIGFRLQWLDASKDDVPGPGLSIDSCAVQLPKAIEKEPPSPQMGEANRPVEITFWRADWQASADGRSDSIRALYPNAAVDHYPFQAQSLESGSAGQREMAARYAPAQALGNRRSGPRDRPVEDLISEGPGTLIPAENMGSSGKGVRTKDGWIVVLKRRLPAGLEPRVRTQVAFAVWEGSQGESGSRKMRTGWIPLLRQGAP
jgi:DMSO reductase family type II enzyme heme b subunit